ncbi:helicase [Finegoldia magna]|uniref:helicase n=1 Tax=Finegoldia magna TaxID=1260 RepID=UPI0029114766|nr:helicase [Finegoldia magna]MDU7164967.1 helicase [Finegoldia magna]
MDKKLKKDFQKKIIRNRDAPEKNMDSKLVHSDDYTNKIIKNKDRFGDKISEKESKLIHENVLAKDQKQDKLKDFQKSKNKERIRKEFLDNKDKVEETKQTNLEIRTDESFKLDEELDVDFKKVNFESENSRNINSNKLTTDDISAKAQPISNKKTSSKRKVLKNYEDKLIHSKDKFQDKINEKESKRIQTSEDKPIEAEKSKRIYRKDKLVKDEVSKNDSNANIDKKRKQKLYQEKKFRDVELTKPFEKADELRDKTLRLAEINKLLDMGEVEELENQSPLLEDLKRAIVDYSNYEFSESNSYEDFDKLYPDLSHIGLAYTETPDGKHTIQYEVNLEEKTWTQYVDNVAIRTESFVEEDISNSQAIKDMTEAIKMSSFDDLVSVDEEDLKQALGLEIDDDGNFYDPLAKDLDNDGIPDRYDNDFKDSDYFESTYDVEDNLQAREEKPSILRQISKFKSEEEKDKNQEKNEKAQER